MATKKIKQVVALTEEPINVEIEPVLSFDEIWSREQISKYIPAEYQKYVLFVSVDDNADYVVTLVDGVSVVVKEVTYYNSFTVSSNSAFRGVFNTLVVHSSKDVLNAILDSSTAVTIEEMATISDAVEEAVSACENKIIDDGGKVFEHKNTATATTEDMACEIMTISPKSMRFAAWKDKNDPAFLDVKKYENIIDEGVSSINTSYLNIAYSLFCIYSKQLSWCYEFMSDKNYYVTKNNNASQFNAYAQERFGLSKTASSNLLGIARNFLKVDPTNNNYRLPELKEESKDYSFSQLCEILPFFVEHNALMSNSKVYKLLPSSMSVADMREQKKKFVYKAGEFVEKLKAPKDKKAKADFDDELLAAAEQSFDKDDVFGVVSDDNKLYRFSNDAGRETFIRNYDKWPTCGKNELLWLTYKILYFNNGDRLIAFVYPKKKINDTSVVKYFWYKKSEVVSPWESTVASIVEYIRLNKLAASFVASGQLNI